MNTSQYCSNVRRSFHERRYQQTGYDWHRHQAAVEVPAEDAVVAVAGATT